jgi:IS30 family transposase
LEVRGVRKAYKKLTYKDRQKIEEMLKAGATPKELAKETGVCIATIYRELPKGGQQYSADEAQKAIFG